MSISRYKYINCHVLIQVPYLNRHVKIPSLSSSYKIPPSIKIPLQPVASEVWSDFAVVGG